MTNRDWLRTLTNSQLLEHIYIRCVAMNGGECSYKLTCKECQLSWLNAKHEEDNVKIVDLTEASKK